MLPLRIAALAIVALVIAATTGLVVVTGAGTLDPGDPLLGVGDASTGRPSTASSTAPTSRSSSAPRGTPTSVASSKPPPMPTPSRSATPTPSATPTSTPALTPAPTSTPTRALAPILSPNTVAIPAQGIRAPIGNCAVVDRSLLPPADVSRTCLWLGGAGLGARSGTTVLAGEAQWADRGPAAFGRIGQLTAGEQVVTYDAGGGATRWRIVEVFRRAKSDGVDPQAFVDGSGPRRLYLISAGGRFDAANGTFSDNVYVQAVPA